MATDSVREPLSVYKYGLMIVCRGQRYTYLNFDFSTMPRTSLISILHFALLARPSLTQENCPPLPETGVQIGEPVPIVPGDIPAGCSAFEILVGQW